MKTYEEKTQSVIDRLRTERRKRSRRRRTAAACLSCLCIAAAAALSARYDSGVPADTPGGSDVSAWSAADSQSGAETYAVVTDSIVLPEGESAVMADMIGCLVYQGKVYTQGQAITGAEPGENSSFLGEYLGEAKGSLSEWSSQEEWTTEFASTYSGSVYTVSGYDPSFRLCIRQETAEGGEMLQLLENLDGIGLNTGADLFGNRLHLREGTTCVLGLSHQDWNDGRYDRLRALDGLSAEQWKTFLDALFDAPFVKLSGEEHPGFYQAETQGHLFLTQTDGTTVELRLFEGGYVGYPKMSWIFAQMPGEAFDAVFAACQ